MLIQLTVTKRGTKNVASLGQAFLVSDITSPITAKVSGVGSVVTVRESRGPAAFTNESAQVVYEVSETLAQIAAMTSELFLTAVISEDGRAATGSRVFNFGYIIDTVKPMPNGINSTFLLREEGKARPSSWVVVSSVAVIVATSASGGGGGSTVPIKLQARLAAPGNVNIAVAPANVDGVAGVVDDRIFLPNQTTQADRGMYIYNGVGVPMTRSLDMNVSSQVKAGMLVVVSEGVDNEDAVFELITNDPIVLGTTALSFARTTLLPVVQKTAVQIKALQIAGTLRPNQLYAVTNAAFQGGTVPYYVMSDSGGQYLMPNGYMVISNFSGTTIYEAGWDVISNTFYYFYDHIYNNKISRNIGGGKNCVDVFPIGNLQFVNVTGEDFNMTNDGNAGNAMDGIVLGANSNVTIADGTQMFSGKIGAFSTVITSGAANLFSFDIESFGSLLVQDGGHVTNVEVGNGATFSVHAGTHNDNVIGANSNIACTNDAAINGCRIGNNCTVVADGAATIVTSTVIDSASLADVSGGSQLVYCNIGSQSNVLLANGSALNGCTLHHGAGVDIGSTVASFSYDSTLYAGAWLQLDNGSQFNGGKLRMGLVLDLNTTLTGCDLMVSGTTDITIADGIARTNQRFVDGFSNMTATLVITGLTTANIGSIFWAGNITLSSTNPVETLDNITNMNGNHDVTFEPEAGLVVTFDDQSVAAGNIYLPATVVSTAINGTNFDYMTVRKRSTHILQVNSQQF